MAREISTSEGGKPTNRLDNKGIKTFSSTCWIRIKASSTKSACRGDSRSTISEMTTPASKGPTTGTKLRSAAKRLKESGDWTSNKIKVKYVAQNTKVELITRDKNHPETFFWDRFHKSRANTSYRFGNKTTIVFSIGRSSMERKIETEMTKIVEKIPPKILNSVFTIFDVSFVASSAMASTKLWKSSNVATPTPCTEGEIRSSKY